MKQRVVDWFKDLPGAVANALLIPVILVGLFTLAAAVTGLVAHVRVHLWIALLAAAAGVVAGVVFSPGRQVRREHGESSDRLEELQRQADELRPYETYAEHVRDALDDLRKLVRNELPGFSLRDFVENGVFQPPLRLLSQAGARGDVRFSILEVDGEDFVMARGNDLSPARGHRMESRRVFRLPIGQSFSQYALRTDRSFWSGQLSEDQRFTRHERADSGREYESIVSVPVRIHGADPDGVFNVIATSQNALTSVDRTYINLLGSVIDVARAAATNTVREQLRREEQGDDRNDTPLS